MRSSYHADEHVEQNRPGVGPLAAAKLIQPRSVFPLRDNIPTEHFPVVTVALIIANAFVYFFLQDGCSAARRRAAATGR